MAELPIMPLKTDALIADTSHMTAEEFGVYMRLLIVMWRHGGRLTNNHEELARIGGVTRTRWKHMSERVLRPMTVVGDTISQKRLTATWLDVGERRRRKAELGASGGRQKWQSTDRSTNAKSRAARLHVARTLATHTLEEWRALVICCGSVCLKCGSSNNLVKDHIMPIYQGGSDGIENLQPLCHSCNSAKGPDCSDLRPIGWRERLAKCLANA